jgi:NodT family efflux transporter outer membrane factor (OMF) lipoprotein
MKRTSILIHSAAALALAGCVVGPDYRRPQLGLTDHFQAEAPARSAAIAAGGLDTWWRGFDDAELVCIVERAQAQNLDLEQARARVTQSRALAKAAGAALAPRIDAVSSAANDLQSQRSPIGEIGRHLPGYKSNTNLYDVGAVASWEIDLFGGLHRAHQAASAEAAASLAEAEAVKVAITADAADAYLQARAFQGRINVARRQEATERDLVALLARQSDEGVASDRELRLTRAELERVQASIPPLIAALDAQLNRLDVIMGAQPGTYRAELAGDGAIPAPPAIEIGRPGDLLRRRPDVLAAEQRLVAANARIGAAIADYYPKLSITGLLGVESVDASQLFTGDAVQHQVAAGLRWRLFDFGRVDAEVAQARGRDAEALAAYRARVLRATEEVEDALSELVQQQARVQALDRQIAELSTARGQAEQAYEGGVLSLIEVRDADRELLTASDQRVLARADAARAAVAAFRALGGGWSANRPVTAAAGVGSVDKGA